MFIFLLFFIGASLSSFLTLLVERYQTNSIIFPSSHCLQCKTSLEWFLIIPVISQLFLRFKCLYCQVNIPKLYFFIELLIGCLWASFSLNLISLHLIIFLTLSFFLAYFDFKYHAFPFYYWLILTGLSCLGQPLNWTFGFFIILAICAEKWDIKIGSGDFFYLASLALWLPLISLLWTIQLASLLGICVFFIKKEQRVIPFVPYLFASFIIVNLYNYFV